MGGAVHIDEILVDAELLKDFETRLGLKLLERRRFRIEVQKVFIERKLTDQILLDILSHAHVLDNLPEVVSALRTLGATHLGEVFADDVAFAQFEGLLNLTYLERKRLQRVLVANTIPRVAQRNKLGTVPTLDSQNGENMPEAVSNEDTASDAASQSCVSSRAGSFEVLDLTPPQPPKCYLPDTAFRSPDGHLLLVQNLWVGAFVLLSDGSEATVVEKKKFPRAGAKKSLRVLATSQGTFEVSSKHRIVVQSGGFKLAENLMPGDKVFIGCKAQDLLNVTEKKASTDLYMVSFNPDGCVEALHESKWGILTKGEPPIEIQGISASGSSVNHSVDNENAFQLLAAYGIADVTSEDLEAAMPIEYSE